MLWQFYDSLIRPSLSCRNWLGIFTQSGAKTSFMSQQCERSTTQHIFTIVYVNSKLLLQTFEAFS